MPLSVLGTLRSVTSIYVDTAEATEKHLREAARPIFGYSRVYKYLDGVYERLVVMYRQGGVVCVCDVMKYSTNRVHVGNSHGKRTGEVYNHCLV